jgi:hypothetical protein
MLNVIVLLEIIKWLIISFKCQSGKMVEIEDEIKMFSDN